MSLQKILIVDDEAPVARSMQKTLMRAGYVVETASGCSEGWRVYKSAAEAGAPFDMALLDLNMPDFHGLPANDAGMQLLTRLQEAQPGFPVVILSAYDDSEKARQAMSLGARGFNIKGREQDLLTEIQSIFK
jgi:DNA-binding NtrC family response regulator